MNALVRMLFSMFPFYDSDFTNSAYNTILENETLIRKMFEISCKMECDTNLYETVEDYPNHCFIMDYVDPERFPEMEKVNYKMPGFYNVATCKTYRLYDTIVNHNSFWNEGDINSTIMVASAYMQTNIQQIDEQRDIHEYHEYQTILRHSNYASVDLVNDIATNGVLNSKVDEIMDHVCDSRCMDYMVPSKLYQNHYIYETPDLCRIKDVELEEGRKYTFHYEYSNGMCELFKLFQSRNVNKHVDPTIPPNTSLAVEPWEIAVVIIGTVIILAIIIAITVCCVKRMEWNRQKREIEENVSA